MTPETLSGNPKIISGNPEITRKEWVAEHFNRCRPWLEAALAKHPLRTHTIEHVREALESGNAQLWPTENSAAVTEITEWPTGLRTLHHWLTGGDLEELKVTERNIEAYARINGLAAITTCGRRGWLRVMPGFREVAVQLLKELK